jgi:hypothetical protein
VEGSFRRIDANHFSAAVYRDRELASSCRIWKGSRGAFVGGIAYSAGQTGADNSYNESLSVVDDGYGLFLKPLGMAFHNQPDEGYLTREGGAEYFWAMLVEPLQR